MKLFIIGSLTAIITLSVIGIVANAYVSKLEKTTTCISICK